AGASAPELEASGRGFVELTKAGDFIDFPCSKPANALVVRFCIPDAAEGGGMNATLGLYLRGSRIQSISLSSKHSWLYGKTGKPGENGQDNAPTEFPHVFWDEARVLLETKANAGDVIRLQKDASDTAAFYRVDLIEPEWVEAPLARPANALSISDYGANGKDAAGDTTAIQKCIDEARAQNKIVWIPAGVFLHNQRFYLDGVKVRGAGMWHSKLLASAFDNATRFGGYCGFSPSGVGSEVRDLSIEGYSTSRKESCMAFIGSGTNWTIHRVWMNHLTVGLWMAGENSRVAECRVRTTYADGININNGKVLIAKNIVVENNHVRGTGDDGIAILSHEHSPNLSEGIVVRHNTVSSAWWGTLCDLAGGSGHVIEDNIFQDMGASGFGIVLPAAYPMNPLIDSVIRRNLILRAGDNKHSQKRGAIWIYPGSTTISNVLIADNRVVDPLFRGIHLTGTKPQFVTFKGNVIERPGEDAIYIEKQVLGAAVFSANAVRQLPQGRRALANEAPAEFGVSLEGNQW
ncbi:MAG: right-handed parallel beta-helix repeat-containing protein, partial [Spirochaetia bacterium]|nr:right-handed parallel beta-helix repeat-containing protein [Spirochaetia bacterium]